MGKNSDNYYITIDPALAQYYTEQKVKEFEEKKKAAAAHPSKAETPAAPSPAPEPEPDKPRQIPNVTSYYALPSGDFTTIYGNNGYDPDIIDEPEDHQQKLNAFNALNDQINQSRNNRYTGDYQHTYHGDAADYAAELADYYKQQQETAAYLINDYKAYRDIIGDDEADSQIASIRARLSALNSAVQLANTDAKYWSRYENEADYSAAMFDEKMYEQHGQSDYQALSQTAKDNEATIQTAMDPYVVNAASAQNDWLEDQAASIATADDYRILKKETEDEYSAVSELYNDHDTSAENMEIYNQKQALEQKLDNIDAIITEKEKQEYYTEMAAELYELPEQLMGDILNIPYLEDEKIQLIGAGIGDYTASFDSDNKRQELNARKEATKQQLRDLGYSDKEIEGFIIYAGLVHDKEQSEAHMAEKQAYAEAHPLYASLGSVLENFFEPMELVDSLSQKFRNALRGEYIPINEYSQIKQHTGSADVIRDTVAGKIEDATGSELLSKLYEKGMSTADIVAQTLATGGASSLGSLGKGLITVAKSFGDDFLRTFIKTYGDDAVRAIAAYGDDAAKLALNSADDATKLLLSSGDDLSRTALSYGDDIGKPLASTGDNMIDDWYGLVDDTVDGAASSWDDVANSLDDVANDALAAKPNTGYNGITTEGVVDYSSLAEKARNVDVSTSAHQAVFYSGEGNRAQAEAFAQLNGKTTLEMTPGGKYFESLKLFDTGSPVTEDQALEIWKILSERYAKSASGNVYGFVKGSRPGSIFNTVEYQALQKNPYITNIFTKLFK